MLLASLTRPTFHLLLLGDLLGETGPFFNFATSPPPLFGRKKNMIITHDDRPWIFNVQAASFKRIRLYGKSNTTSSSSPSHPALFYLFIYFFFRLDSIYLFWKLKSFRVRQTRKKGLKKNFYFVIQWFFWVGKPIIFPPIRKIIIIRKFACFARLPRSLSIGHQKNKR